MPSTHRGRCRDTGDGAAARSRRAVRRALGALLLAGAAYCAPGAGDGWAIAIPVTEEHGTRVAGLDIRSITVVRRNEPQYDSGTGIDLRELAMGRLPHISLDSITTGIDAAVGSGRSRSRVLLAEAAAGRSALPGLGRARMTARAHSTQPGVAGAGTVASAQPGTGGDTMRLGDFVKSLINIERAGPLRDELEAAMSEDEADADPNSDMSMLRDLLSLRIGRQMAEQLNDVVTPRMQADGMVSFTIAGMGNFAIVLSEEAGALSIVDFTQGGSMTFKVNRGGAGSPLATARGPHAPTEQIDDEVTFDKFLSAVKRFLFSVLQNNLFIVGIILLSTLCIVWRFNRRSH